jgi:molybdopterin-guanine dinucleotide biosynthesis protein A
MIPNNNNSINNNKIGGIILAGGRSSRMGRNKALLQLEESGPTLIEKVMSAVQTVADQIWLVTNEPETYRWLNLNTTSDNYPHAGPLAGIEAGLVASQYEYNLVVGCDMPFLVPALLKELARRAKMLTPNPMAVVPLNQENEAEPLCAIYAKSSLAVIQKCLQTKQHRLKEFLEQIEVEYVVAAELEEFDKNLRSFANLNSPADLR